ncbi:MAG: hypothetical protein Q4C96_04080 [Planctomycetia bacterium]|nr:hypothetical protein [Planctomycetia bacterium]
MTQERKEELFLGYILDALDDEASEECVALLSSDKVLEEEYVQILNAFRPVLVCREEEKERVILPPHLISRTMESLYLNASQEISAGVSVSDFMKAEHAGAFSESSHTMTQIHSAVTPEVLRGLRGKENYSEDFLEKTSDVDLQSGVETRVDRLDETRVLLNDLSKQKETDFVSEPVSVSSGKREDIWFSGNIRNRRFRYLDVFVGVFLFSLVVLVMFPILVQTREHSRLSGCKNNMRQIGQALQQFSQAHAGFFPGIQSVSDKKHYIAGVYGPALIDANLLSPQVIWCPSVTRNSKKMNVPSLARLMECGEKHLTAQLHRAAGGDYAYNIGFIKDGVYVSPKDHRRAWYVLLADAPMCVEDPISGGVSLAADVLENNNHGKLGMNLLFEDGHVSTHPVPVLKYKNGQDDHLFRNHAGHLAPGVNEMDVVLGRSELPIHVPSVSP